MKLTKKRLKEIIKSELNEWSPTYDEVGPILADLLNELEDKLKRLNKDNQSFNLLKMNDINHAGPINKN